MRTFGFGSVRLIRGGGKKWNAWEGRVGVEAGAGARSIEIEVILAKSWSLPGCCWTFQVTSAVVVGFGSLLVVGVGMRGSVGGVKP